MWLIYMIRGQGWSEWYATKQDLEIKLRLGNEKLLTKAVVEILLTSSIITVNQEHK